MDKIAVGAGLPDEIVDPDATPEENLKNLALAKKVDIADIVACILDRPRHSELIQRVRAAGARIMLIFDGDVSGVISTSRPRSGLDTYIDSGGGQGVLAARYAASAAASPVFRNDDEGPGAAYGCSDRNRKYKLLDRQGRRDVRHRRHRHHAARRAARSVQRLYPFEGHALQDRHGTVDRGPSQLDLETWL
jgi:fructose-1,6-bisphosphatase II / sedoheptulose-1,7-bisphosphatase